MNSSGIRTERACWRRIEQRWCEKIQLVFTISGDNTIVRDRIELGCELDNLFFVGVSVGAAFDLGIIFFWRYISLLIETQAF